MKTRYKIATGVVFGSLLFSVPAKAFFGEDIPFLINLVRQGIQDYRLATQAYNQAKRAGYYFTHLNVRQILFNSLNTATQDLYGETLPWTGALATGTNTSPAWARASVPLSVPSWMQSDRIGQSRLASIEILNSAGARAMAVHGQALVQTNSLAANLDNPTIQDQVQMQQISNNTNQAMLEIAIAQTKVVHDQIAERMGFDADVEQHSQSKSAGLGPQSSKLGWVPE